MSTKLWIRTIDSQPAILISQTGAKVLFRIGDQEYMLPKEEWERLPLWTGPSPFLNEGKHGAS
ncbi:MAG: hypothetical protein JWM91_2619 [Rhodospirillales bacterium]|nr:hypothetical protein [Rhodospirillales bacterium]